MSSSQQSRIDLLAVGAHPDDVELACGGTLARAHRRGQQVGILHLTRGEMGTRGTPETRREEAARAAEILGARMEILDCGDGYLRSDPESQNAVIEVLRSWRPRVVLGPPPRDRHPDHAAAHQLVAAACFYAGLENRAPELGPPHRPAATFHYMQHDNFEPRFVIDVSDVWELRQRAVAAYRSQVYSGFPEGAGKGQDQAGAVGDGSEEPLTKIASEDFWRSIEGRARHFGNLIGATFGEPFGSRLPLAVDDPVQHGARGIL